MWLTISLGLGMHRCDGLDRLIQRYVVQVLVKGKDIPENAIVAGEERRQPLYIARTFYEVCDIVSGFSSNETANVLRRAEFVWRVPVDYTTRTNDGIFRCRKSRASLGARGGDTI
jgi:hypothetical protein